MKNLSEMTPAEAQAWNDEGLDRTGYHARPMRQSRLGETRWEWFKAWVRWKLKRY